MSLEVRYSTPEGITLRGTDRSQGKTIAKGSWRWYRSGGFWYIPRTRDTVQSRVRVEALAEHLRQALGVDVSVSYELEDVRPAEEREADRKERAGARADRLDDRADKLAREGNARLEVARKTGDAIPMGQPILVGHHSEKRHRRDLERIHSNMDKGFTALSEAGSARASAEAAIRNEKRKNDPGAILRRIDRLEADRRKFERSLSTERDLAADFARGFVRKITGSDFRTIASEGGEATFWDILDCGHREPYEPEKSERTERVCSICAKGFSPEGRESWIAEAEVRLRAIIDEIGHLRSKIESVDLPEPARYRKGDAIETRWGRAIVLRINPKTLTVQLVPERRFVNPPAGIFKIKYDDLVGTLGIKKASEQSEQK